MKGDTSDHISHLIQRWSQKGWISPDGRKEIQRTLQATESKQLGIVYSFVLIIGLAMMGMIVLWSMAKAWYYVYPIVRVGLAVGILVVSQVGLAVTLFREWQETIRAELMGVIQFLLFLISVGIITTTYYLGWSIADYIIPCAVITLPASYVLRSVSGVLLYNVALLVGAAYGDVLQTISGTIGLGICVLLEVPFYGFVHCEGIEKNKRELGLTVFSWGMTITVLLIFFLVAMQSVYIPFLTLATLGIFSLFVGQTIDVRRAWGTPLRWLGKIAAIGALWISCLPEPWHGIAAIQGFHWSTLLFIGFLLVGIVILFLNGVKKQFGALLLYGIIPFLIIGETILVRCGLYSTIPLLASAVYLFGIGLFEVIQILYTKQGKRWLFGVAIWVSLLVNIFYGNVFSPWLDMVSMVVIGGVIVQWKRYRHTKEQKKVRIDRRKKRKMDVVKMEEKDKDKKVIKQSVIAEDMTMKTKTKLLTTKFVAPVFHQPDQISLSEVPVIEKEKKMERITTSPWQKESAPVKRETKSVSPWSQEGGKIK